MSLFCSISLLLYRIQYGDTINVFSVIFSLLWTVKRGPTSMLINIFVILVRITRYRMLILI